MTKSRGIGRGNGIGSAASQFREGMPSGNPGGRPKKPKAKVDSSVGNALLRALSKRISVRRDGVSSKMPRLDALIEMLFDQYPAMPNRDKLSFLKFIASAKPEEIVLPPKEIPEESIEALVAELAKFAVESGASLD